MKEVTLPSQIIFYWLVYLILCLCAAQVSDGFLCLPLSIITTGKSNNRPTTEVTIPRRRWKLQYYERSIHIVVSASTNEYSHSDNSGQTEVGNNPVENTRQSLVILMDASWNNMTQMIPAHVLQSCESSLKANTALLVLAAIRHAANRYSTSRSTFEGMLMEADQNNDGQLSYVEWFEWLRQSDDTEKSFNTAAHNSDTMSSYDSVISYEEQQHAIMQRRRNAGAYRGLNPINAFSYEAFAAVRDDFIDVEPDGSIQHTDKESIKHHLDAEIHRVEHSAVPLDSGVTTVKGRLPASSLLHHHSAADSESIHEYNDPMVTAIDQVLASAVRTLRVVARMTDEADLLAASFVAGGLIAGGLDESISSQLLARLPDQTRELILVAIAIESTSSSTASTSSTLLKAVASSSAATPPSVATMSSSSGVRRRRRSSSVSSNLLLRQITVKSTPTSQFDAANDTTISSLGLLSNSFRYESQPDYTTVVERGKNFDSKHGTTTAHRNNSNRADENIIMTVDLSSIPVVEAPPIDDGELVLPQQQWRQLHVAEETDVGGLLKSIEQDVAAQLSSNRQVATTADIDSEDGVDDNYIPMVEAEELVNTEAVAQNGIRFDAEVDCNNPTDTQVASDHHDQQQHYLQAVVPIRAAHSEDTINDQDGGLEEQQRGSRLEEVHELMHRIANVINDMRDAQADLEDLDDSNAAKIRALVATKSGNRLPVLSLVFALRISRLQDAKRRLRKAKRQQIALETLQFFAPLSYQVKLHAFTQELEIYSYVHLYPTAFGSFINWYNAFQPTAQRVIARFRSQLEAQLEKDPMVRAAFFKICIQSRPKAPGSAFKKMIQKGQIVRDLHDLLGVRIIAHQRTIDMLETATSKHSSSGSNYSTGDDENSSSSSGDNDDYNIYLQVDQDHVGSVEDTIVNHLGASLPVLSKSNASYPPLKSVDVTRSPPPTVVADVSTASDFVPSSTYEVDAAATAGLYSIVEKIQALPGWIDIPKRFKDYVGKPKLSGYQSIHLCMRHASTDVVVEVQVRSDRMHWEAEYGRASHSNYKALLLPAPSPQRSS